MLIGSVRRADGVRQVAVVLSGVVRVPTEVLAHQGQPELPGKPARSVAKSSRIGRRP